MFPRIVFVLPATTLHGGNRIVFELAAGLAGRGFPIQVVSPEPAPSWHEVGVDYRQLPIFEPGAVPRADIAIGTFFSTMGPAFDSGARHVFHLCQGFEGVHREYEAILPAIDAAYQLPVPKLLISQHLAAILEPRYGSRCHWIGQFVDPSLFRPVGQRAENSLLTVGLVGSFEVRSKGIREALAGLALARRAGSRLRVLRASAEPMSEEEHALGVTDEYFHHLPTRDMPAFYQRLDALLFSSFDEEGFGLPPLEAMACGVPVAVTNIQPLAVLPDGAVLRFPPGDPGAVVPVVAALSSRSVRERLSVAALDAARAFTPERVLDRIENAFRAEGIEY